MNEYYFKPTKMEGIIELGHIEPDYSVEPLLPPISTIVRGRFNGLADKRFLNLFAFLKLEVSDISYLNPQTWESSCRWHTDGSESFIVCLGAESKNSGTIFRKYAEEFQIKPWYIYWIKDNPEHKAVCLPERRILYRFTIDLMR